MKKQLLSLACVGLFISCNPNDDTDNFVTNVYPVNTVEMPNKFAVDSITQIPLTFNRPSSCHFLDGFYYEKSDFTRTVAVLLTANRDQACQTVVTPTQTVLKFKPQVQGTYHFKFWKGENPQGIDEFFEYDVVVDH
ncbi:hypothetical protein [Flavobacterium croceum]|jgi:hypothetical protein|uniref:hypothetical protein n=1 Tax=Flavobacterium croceum TaxID=370975 RepID=UPI0024A895A0|nr:hypothetical protein [Flavobacterium croceum]